MTVKDGHHREHEMERTIARLIVAGHKDHFVARTLHMSPRTLHRILERLLHRHGLPNRAALGAFAAARGWLPEFTSGTTGDDDGGAVDVSGRPPAAPHSAPGRRRSRAVGR